MVPEDRQNGYFDSDSYRPGNDEIEKYIKKLKHGEQRRDYKGSCTIDWSPDGFTNHMISGECSSSSDEPKISLMFCADAEIPVLCRCIMNGGREPVSDNSK